MNSKTGSAFSHIYVYGTLFSWAGKFLSRNLGKLLDFSQILVRNRAFFPYHVNVRVKLANISRTRRYLYYIYYDMRVLLCLLLRLDLELQIQVG